MKLSDHYRRFFKSLTGSEARGWYAILGYILVLLGLFIFFGPVLSIWIPVGWSVLTAFVGTIISAILLFPVLQWVLEEIGF